MKKFRNILWGVVLILIGLVIGGNSLGITNIDLFFDGWWTLFIIVPSFIGLFKENEKTGNAIGLLIGVALLLACQDIINFDIIAKLWFPAILVCIGVSIIFKDTIGSKVNDQIKKLNENKTNQNEYCATFSGTNISIPPKILLVFTTISDSIIAFLKSHSIPPNTAVKSAPVNFSSSNFKS